MIHTLLITLTWLIGIFGTGGALAFVAGVVWLGPSATLRIVEPLLACAKCLIAIAAVIAVVGAYWIGRHEAESDCIAQAAQSRVAAQQADQRAARRAATDESDMVRKIEEVARQQHEADLAEIEALRGRPDACLFDDTDGMRDGSSGPARKTTSTPAGSAHKAATSAAPHPPLWLSLVRKFQLQGSRPAGDAAPDGQ